jgi:Rrf2 family protein
MDYELKTFKEMFRLSQKADYGLILLSSLARVHPRGVLRRITAHPAGVNQANYFSISKIAAKHKLSPKFLSQIAQDLKKAGILISKEGVSGGYSLAKSAEKIKLLDVLCVLEGKVFEGKWFEGECTCVCGAKGIWREMKDQIQRTLSAKTVADLMGV